MKIYISCDMEGVAGVVHRDQTIHGGEGYSQARELLTGEVNAAIRGVRRAGATEVVVNDSHLHMRNLLIEKIEPQTKVILGDPKTYSMVEGIDPSYDAALFIGYHAKVGTQGAVIDHSYYSSGIIQEVRINGQAVGETVINGGVAGYYGVPVVLVSGDDKVTREAKEAIPGVTVVEVKRGLGRFAALTLTPSQACALIEEAAERAVACRSQVEPLVFKSPIALEVDFSYTTMADVAACVPGVTRMAGRTVRFVSDDYLEVFRAFQTIYRVAETVK